MPDSDAAAPRQALKYTGDPAQGHILGGVPAQDLTAEQTAVWLTQAQYDEALATGWYKEANKTETKRIEQAVPAGAAPVPAPDAGEETEVNE